MAVSQEEHLQELSKGYRFDWKDADHSVFQPKRGLSPAVVEEVLGAEVRAGLDAQVPAEGAEALRASPDAVVGRRPIRHRLRQHLLLHPLDREAGRELGPAALEDIKGTWDKLGDPRGREEVPRRASLAEYESKVVYHKIKKEVLYDTWVLFTDMGSALRDYPDLVKEYFGTLDPAQRQQVRRAELGRVVGWLVHLRAAGRAGRHPAPGVLPG